MTAKELTDKLWKAHVTSEDLDEVVHELKAEEATRINNEGFDAQLEYILLSTKPEEILRQFDIEA